MPSWKSGPARWWRWWERTALELSGGARQKLNVALALLGDPPILLLDEPYQGFDRGAYINFWDHVQVWRAEGRAVVVVTHLLAELDRVDRVVELSIPTAAPDPSVRSRRRATAESKPHSACSSRCRCRSTVRWLHTTPTP